MAAYFKEHVLWSHSKGHVPGGIHGSHGGLLRGFIYVRYPKSASGVDDLFVRLNNGSMKAVKSGSLDDATIKVTVLGITTDGETVLEVTSKDNSTGVFEVVVTGYYRTSPNDYNPVNLAEFRLFGGKDATKVVPNGGNQILIDSDVMPAWYNEEIYTEGEVIVFKPHDGDLLVTFSFRAKATSDNSDPHEWLFRLKRTDGEIIAMVSGGVINSANQSDCRQLNITSYIRGPEDPFVTQGVTPEIVNLSGKPITFADSLLRVYTVKSPRVAMDYY